MKKTNNLLMGLIPLALMIFSSSCKKCVDMIMPSADSVNVYVAGYDVNPTTTAIEAVYWKNGKEKVLSDTFHNAFGTSMVISGNDVYVAGYQIINNGSNYQAIYWKNGTAVVLSNTPYYAEAWSIAVSGNDVYVAGIENNGIKNVAKYWKNGVAVSLSDGTHDAFASSIAISGTDVYVAGYENNGAAVPYYQRQGLNNGVNNIAKYWKNGTAIPLTDGTEYARAFSIFVSGSDIYVAGQENTGTEPNATNLAKYWKNGIPVILSDGTSNASATAIATSGSGIYTAGYGFTGSYYFAEYWKNNTQTILPNTYYTGNGVTTSIALYGQDVYVAGYEGAADGHSSMAVYWKNGIQVPLTKPNGTYQTATSIVVVKQ